MAGNVLSNLKQTVKNRTGCRIGSSIIHKAGDGKRIGFRGTLQVSREEREKFVLTGFSYLPDRPETIGVMKKLALIGEAEGRKILVYFLDQPFSRSMLFYPEAFLHHGEPEAKQETRKRRNERWLNLERDLACSLREYADGRDEPQLAPRKKAEPDGGWFNV